MAMHQGKGIPKPVDAWKDGVLHGSYSSIAEAARKTGVSTISIGLALKGKDVEMGGYVWKLAGEKPQNAIPAVTAEDEKANGNILYMLECEINAAGWLMAYPDGEFFLDFLRGGYRDLRDVLKIWPSDTFFRKAVGFSMVITEYGCCCRILEGLQNKNNAEVIEAMRMLYENHILDFTRPKWFRKIGPKMVGNLIKPNRICYATAQDLPRNIQLENNRLLMAAKSWAEHDAVIDQMGGLVFLADDEEDANA